MADSIVSQLNDGNIAGAVPDQIAPQSKLAQQVSDNPKRIREFLSELFGIKDAVRAYKGEMTEDEAQNFALTAALGVVPMAGEAAPAVRAVEDMAPEAAQSIVKMIRAYHGSPYDFPAERLVQYPSGETAYIQGTPQALPDVPQGATVLRDFPLGRMRLDKIGTGEGAQAYGRGLYNSEEERVAQQYREQLFGRGMDLPSYRASQELENAGGNVEEALASLQSYRDRLIGHGPVWKEVGEAIDLLKSGNLPPRGRMYEVNIAADPEHFLDWDKPLSEQSEKVQQALQQLSKKKAVAERLGSLENLTGAGAYGAIGRGHTAGFFSGVSKAPAVENDAAATEALRQAGIPGIKYLDQGSRGAGAGTRNYVVFDDKLIDIVKKYGLAGLIAAGATNFTPKKK